MRNPTAFAAALLAGLMVACGSHTGTDLGPRTHPTLDQDYSASFAAVWTGSWLTSIGGQSQSGSGSQPITRTGFNRLAIADVCGGIDGVAGLDSATTFSMDPLVCPPVSATCGPVTLTVTSGTGVLQSGTLTVQFGGTASGCGQNLPFTITFTGTKGAPVNDHGAPTAVLASASLATSPNVPVALDASGSTDPDGRELQFAWTITSQPAGASATLTGADTAQPTFASATLGDYQLSLVVTAADSQSATAQAQVSVAEPLVALTHGVASARYSLSLDRIVMTDGIANALFVYNPATGGETKVDLPLAPRCLSVSPDGTRALVGHDAWISYVDLVQAKVEKKIPVATNVSDCVMAGNGWAHLFPASYNQAFESVEIATGVETIQPTIYQGSSGVLSLDGAALYTVTTGLSPAQIYRFSVSNGAAVYGWGSPYWGDHGMSAPLWMSRDGARLFTASATAYRTASVQAQDLLYGGSLSAMSRVRWLDTSATEVAAIADPTGYSPTPQSDSAVEIFNTEFLGHVDRITLPKWLVGSTAYDTHGRFVFYNAAGTEKYVIVQADAASGLLNDTAVLKY
jgi:chitinase